ncbi:uncharacterized protein LODBEIA_P57940 [Lodderomyces beijingensis]|uniref:A to I editase domain-containing protein n=1 Tax=Lodderomyces beijingensis TaxID=1775926 RepID=A0ABP0ZVT5_9ASCO
MDQDGLGNKIAKTVIETFASLNLKSGKPTTRSNGVEEWTVLASIVAIHPDRIQPLTIATGVKTLPESVRSYSNGLVVHDMHAETLAVRLFNLFLLGECRDPASVWVEKSDDEEGTKWRWKDGGGALALFVTEPPCGDLSMGYLTSRVDSNEPWPLTEAATGENTDDSLINGVVRGRRGFGQLGVVRTKPGRADSLISYSKSCSDKLCLKQLTGIGNGAVASVMEPVFLEHLVVRGVKQEDFQRCFVDRFQVPGARHWTMISYDINDYEFHKSDTKEVSLVSLLYIVPQSRVQVLNNGIKQGAALKKQTPKAGSGSMVCNRNFMKELAKLQKTQANTYLEFKTGQLQRQQLKQQGRAHLRNWVPTGADDFSL